MVKQVFILVFSLISFSALGQFSLIGYAEVGHSSVLNSYGSFVLMPGYNHGNMKVEFGISGLGSGEKENFIDGLYANGSYGFFIKENPLTLTLGYLWKSPSIEIRETDIYLSVDYKLVHWKFLLGNNFRTYRFSKSFREEQGWTKEDSRIKEPWNLMYMVTYILNSTEKNWNLDFSLTNIDYFLIEQETNPLFKIKGIYLPRSELELFSEFCYKTAGMMNLQVNHYGFYFRIGVKWNI